MTAPGPLSALTLDAVQAEALRAHLKHGNQSLLNPHGATLLKLAALVEEVGEVARLLTYDHAGRDRSELVGELLQVASVALSWIESIEGLAARVPAPAPCRHCHGAGQVTLAADPCVLWPCPTCCCHVCGQPTDTPPECGACAQLDEAQAKRRADR